MRVCVCSYLDGGRAAKLHQDCVGGASAEGQREAVDHSALVRGEVEEAGGELDGGG